MPDENGDLSVEELNTVIEHLYSLAEDALENGGREELRSALSDISDICNPDSELDVDVAKGTVEISSWADDGDDEEAA